MKLVKQIDPIKVAVRNDGEPLYVIGKCQIGHVIGAAVEIKGTQMPLDQLLRFNYPDEFTWDDAALAQAEEQMK